MSSRYLPCLCLLALAVGCQAGDGDNPFEDDTGNTFPPSTSGSGDSGGSGGSTGGPGGSGDSSGQGSDGTMDGSSGSTGMLPVEPCTALDIMFVVDNTETMLEEQLALQGAAFGFINMLAATIPAAALDINIGVVPTDESNFFVNAVVPCMPYVSGQNYMTMGPELQTELGCALNVGVAGNPDERPMQMSIDALSAQKLGVGGFNEGFIRDHALLVMVIVTDEEDDFEAATMWGSTGDPPEWAQSIKAVKGGPGRNVVPVAIVGTEKPNACPPFQWDGVEGAEIATRIIEFTDEFPRSAVGDACGAEYATFLLAEVDTIAQACANYSPP